MNNGMLGVDSDTQMDGSRGLRNSFMHKLAPLIAIFGAIPEACQRIMHCPMVRRPGRKRPATGFDSPPLPKNNGMFGVVVSTRATEGV